MSVRARIQLKAIPRGYAGTLSTVDHDNDMIRKGAKDFSVRQTAIAILRRRDVRPKDYLGEIKALFEWVQRHVRYTRDPFRVEVLHSPRRMLQLRAGDCDDMAILLGAMLEAIGHSVRLVLTGSDPLVRDRFTHIYIEVLHKGRWVPLDATMPYPMGWAPRAPVRKVIGMSRGTYMTGDNGALQGLGDPSVPEWLKRLLRTVRSESMSPKDPRVKSLWGLLRDRQLLNRDVWIKTVLRRMWNEGLPARPRPRTTERLVSTLRHWQVLPPRHPHAVIHRAPPRPVPIRAVRPVAARPVGTARRAPLQPLRPVRVRGAQS
jgi:hypothetical protein